MIKPSKLQKAEDKLARQDRRRMGIILAKVYIPILALCMLGWWYIHEQRLELRQEMLPRLEEQTYIYKEYSPDSSSTKTSITPTYPVDTLQDDIDARVEDALNRIMD